MKLEKIGKNSYQNIKKYFPNNPAITNNII